MEVLIKVPEENIAPDGTIRAKRGKIFIHAGASQVINFGERQVALRMDRIVGAYEGEDGLYLAYTVGDLGELVTVVDVAAS